MNYRKDMERSIEFIEMNILEKLTAQKIADEIGYSLYHYCRIFLACYGMSVMGYVRKRRLTLAHIDLIAGEKVLDVALKYDFETASGFSKAFRKEFDLSPKIFIKREKSLKREPKIRNQKALKVAGYKAKVQLEEIGRAHV